MHFSRLPFPHSKLDIQLYIQISLLTSSTSLDHCLRIFLIQLLFSTCSFWPFRLLTLLYFESDFFQPFPFMSFSVPCLSSGFLFAIHGLGFFQALFSLPDRISWMVFIAFFLRPEQLGHGVGKFLLISLPTVPLFFTAHLASTF